MIFFVDGMLMDASTIIKSLTKNPKKGITELRYIDATKIKKVRKIEKEKDVKHVDKIKKINEFFLYNEKGLGSTGANQGIQIHPDAISYVTSGVIDGNSGRVLSYLHKAIKPVNQLRMMEDSFGDLSFITRTREKNILH